MIHVQKMFYFYYNGHCMLIILIFIGYGRYTMVLKKLHMARKVVTKMVFIIINWHTLLRRLPTPALECQAYRKSSKQGQQIHSPVLSSLVVTQMSDTRGENSSLYSQVFPYHLYKFIPLPLISSVIFTCTCTQTRTHTHTHIPDDRFHKSHSVS